MKFRRLVGAGFALWAAVAIVGAQQPSSAPNASLAASARPAEVTSYRALLDKYCVTCHNDRAKTADLSFQTLDLDHPGSDAAIWERVIRKLNVRAMPPQGMPHPTDGEIDGLLSWLTSQ